MTSSRNADVIVIGAGVIGCSIALELARRQNTVMVVDKLPAAGYGSTSSSSGIIRFHYSTEPGVAMAWEGRHYWWDWPRYVRAEAGPDGAESIEHEAMADVVNLPMFMLLDSGDPAPPFIAHFDALGVPYEIRPTSELGSWPTAIDPRMFGPPARLDDLENPFWGEPSRQFDQVLWMPDAGYVPDPQLAAQNLYTAALAEGVEFRFRSEVAAIDRSADGSRVSGVTLADGQGLAAPVVVNVAGPHSSMISQLAGATDDMARIGRALRREVYLAPAPPGFDTEHGFLGGDLDTGVYYRPESGDNIMVGSVEPECDELEWVDPDDFDETLDEDEFQQSMMRAARRLPEIGIPHSKRGLVALYDATEDWTPIYDRSSLDGFYLACGTSGNQFKNAGVAGHVMAELVTAVEGGHDHDAEPLVVTGPYTGLAIATGTFSRLRPVDPDAASSVLG